MSDDFGDPYYGLLFLMPPPEDEPWSSRARNLFRERVKFIRAAEFALSLGCAAGAWFAGSDMFLAVPGLIFAWIFAAAGLVASNLSSRLTILLCVVAAAIFVTEGGILYWHFDNSDIRNVSRERLIKMSDEEVGKLRSLQDSLDAEFRERERKRQPLMGVFNEYLAKYRVLRPEARRVAVEVLRRRGIDPPYPPSIIAISGALSLLEGFDAGSTPIGDAANFLEDQTRALPAD
jgi:hypothetical protein